jgi:hypothetical protein
MNETVHASDAAEPDDERRFPPNWRRIAFWAIVIFAVI